jgi:hypothetical protein
VQPKESHEEPLIRREFDHNWAKTALSCEKRLERACTAVLDRIDGFASALQVGITRWLAHVKWSNLVVRLGDRMEGGDLRFIVDPYVVDAVQLDKRRGRTSGHSNDVAHWTPHDIEEHPQRGELGDNHLAVHPGSDTPDAKHHSDASTDVFTSSFDDDPLTSDNVKLFLEHRHHNPARVMERTRAFTNDSVVSRSTPKR